MQDLIMMTTVPVHEVNEHLWILLMLFHLNSVSENHVQVEHQILDLKFSKVQRSTLVNYYHF